MTTQDQIDELNAILEKLMLTTDVMERFNVTRATVANWVRRGQLKAEHGPKGIGYVFDPYEVDKFNPPKSGNPNFRKQENASA